MAGDTRFLDQWQRTLLLREIAVERLSEFSCDSSQSSNSHRVLQREPGDTYTWSRLQDRRETLSLGNPDPFPWTVRMFALCSEGYTISSKAAFYTNILGKIIQNKGRQYICSWDVRKNESPMEKLSWKNVVSMPMCALGLFPLLPLGHHLNWNVVVLTVSSFCSQTGLGNTLDIFYFPWIWILEDFQGSLQSRKMANQLGVWKEEVTFWGG